MTTTSRPTDIDAVRAALEPEYEILEEIGRGGMAVVYRARERELDREVAIKVLPAQFAFDENFVERFQREGRIAAQLEHPHVVPIHRVGRNGHVVYFAMKLLRGQSLSDRLREHGRLDASEVRRILLETSSALGYAARRGVVHRDIKPDNIMLDEDGRCIVTDFGIARSATESKLTATGMSVGTPRYMSPEQARATALDGRSDIYSLGVVGYECLVGTTPFHGGDAFAILMAHINDPVPRPALATADEREVFQVIERMLAKNPMDRFQTAEEVGASLRSPSLWPDAAAERRDATSPTIVSPVAFPMLDAGPRALRAGQATAEAGRATDATAVAAPAPHGLAMFTIVARKAEVASGYVRSRTRRFWTTTVAACVGAVALYYGVHFATAHRSRCPAPTVAGTPVPAVGGKEGTAASPRTESFSVLIDALRAQRPGNDLDLYYDVCGLDRGIAYTASVTIARNESGLKRLLGRSVQPVTVSFDGTAGGPAERHHETIDFADMPSGSYSLTLAVSDASERRRTKTSAFQVLNP